MKIEVLREISGVQKISGEWRELLEKMPGASPFQTPEFQLSWWQHLGGGEWEGGQLYILLGRAAGGELAGIAPLFQPQGRGAHGQLLLIGSHEIADYLDFIAPPEHLAPFLHAVLDHLHAEKSIASMSLDLFNLPEYSPSLKILGEAAHSRAWDFQMKPLQTAPAVPLPHNWETYLSNLSKKQRHEVRRKMRRAANHIPPAELHIAGTKEQSAEMLETLFEFMRQNEQKRAFLTEKMQDQLRTILQASGDHGWLQISELRFGRFTAAVELNFKYRGKVWAYNSGSHAAFLELSPGVVLHALLIQQAIEQGYTIYDFMRGDEEYKFRMGGQARDVFRIILTSAD